MGIVSENLNIEKTNKKARIITIIISVIIGLIIFLAPAFLCFVYALGLDDATGAGACAFIPILTFIPAITTTLAIILFGEVFYSQKSEIAKILFLASSIIILIIGIVYSYFIMNNVFI